MLKIQKHTKGATATEYGILIALIGAIGIGSVALLGSDVSKSFDSASSGMQAADVGGGAVGDETGGSSEEAMVPVPGEGSMTCVTDRIGYDDLQEAEGGRSAYTFPGDCLLITTDGDTTFYSLDSLHPGAGFHARINVPSGNPTSSLTFGGGSGHTVVHESGSMGVSFEGSFGQVWLPDVSVETSPMRMVGQRAVLMESQNGSELVFDLLYVDPASDTVGSTSDIIFHFAGQSLTSSELKPVVFEKMTTAGDDSIDGTDTADVIYLNEGGMDNLDLYGGDDTVYWTSGSFDIRPQGSSYASLDTLRIPDVSMGDALPSIDGYDYVITLPSGETGRLLFADLYSDTRKGIDQIIFSDVTLSGQDMVDWFNSSL